MIYLDSCLLIALLESPGTDAVQITAALQKQKPRAIAVSELVRLECLVGCRRAGDALLESYYESYFAQPSVQILQINRCVWNRAITLRSQHAALRVPDALHLATAIEHRCRIFWSFDQRLLAVAERYISVLQKN